MSRLIDADEIKIRLPFKLPRYNMMLLRNSIIQGVQNTPTVEAIPIEWLREWAMRYSYVDIVEIILSDYRRGQSADDETD